MKPSLSYILTVSTLSAVTFAAPISSGWLEGAVSADEKGIDRVIKRKAGGERTRRRAGQHYRASFAAVKKIIHKRWGFSLMNDGKGRFGSSDTKRKGLQHPCSLFAKTYVNYTCASSSIKRRVAKFRLRGYGLYLRCPHYSRRAGRVILAYLNMRHLRVYNQQSMRVCGSQGEMILFWKTKGADDYWKKRSATGWCTDNKGRNYRCGTR